jgi:hypothetical protein
MTKESTQQNIAKIFNLNHSLLRRIFTGAALLFIFMLLHTASFAQITLTDIRDAYVDSTAPTSNFGSSTSLKVGITVVTQGQTTSNYYQRSFIEFDKSSLPINLSSSDIIRATLKLYVNKVTAPLSGMYVYPVCNTFNESAVTWSAQPGACANGTTYSQVITNANQFVAIDVKPLITHLLNSGSTTFTFMLASPSQGNIAFNSKESGGNSPVLELDFTEINSIYGTDGLTGGGDSGDLLLSIANGGVTTPKIADGAVTSTKIASGAVGNAQLSNNSVNTNNIAPGAVNTLQLADNSVTSNKISSGAVTSNQLSNGSVTEAKLADNSVTNSKIANGAVTETKLADGSVTNAKIADGAISGSKIAPNSVGASQITTDAVGNNQLSANSVTSDKIASGQVVKTVNGITDNVNLIAGNNITITPSGNSLTISSTGVTTTPQTPTYNPQQVALLRWYPANKVTAFSTGNVPCAAAFDGSNMWVSNYADNTVVKMRPGDGQILGTYAVGSGPCRMAFDGSNLWVINYDNGTVSKLRASDGQLLATVPVGNDLAGIAFDGENIWVSAQGDNKVIKLRVSDGAVLGFANVNRPTGLAFDGTNIWTGNNVVNGSVTKISGTGSVSVLGIFYTGQSFAVNVAFDGANIWSVNSGSQSITKFRASDGALLGTFQTGFNTVGIGFDGTNIWVPSDTTLYKFRAGDGTLLGAFPKPPSNYGNVAFDGANIWVTNQSAGTVTKH